MTNTTSVNLQSINPTIEVIYCTCIKKMFGQGTTIT